MTVMHPELLAAAIMNVIIIPAEFVLLALITMTVMFPTNHANMDVLQLTPAENVQAALLNLDQIMIFGAVTKAVMVVVTVEIPAGPGILIAAVQFPLVKAMEDMHHFNIVSMIWGMHIGIRQNSIVRNRD